MKELITIQSRLKAPKKNVNKFGGYNYRKCEDILEAAKPICNELNCAIILSDDIVVIADRVYVKATATILNSEGATYSVNAYAREEESKKGMDNAQVTGSASSYARKYALNGLLAIDDTNDPDTYEQPTEKPKKKPIGGTELDSKEKCKALVDWVYKKYLEVEDKQAFNAAEYLAQHYEVSDHNKKRFNEIFKYELNNRLKK